MEPWQVKLKAEIKKTTKEFYDVERHLWSLKYQCVPHVYEKRDNTAVCVICGHKGGWWCEKSPDNVCAYDTDENCIFCGEPEERK